MIPAAAVASAAPSAVAYYVKFGAPVPTVPKGGLLVGGDATSAASAQSPIGSQLPVPVTTPPGVPSGDVIGPTAISAVRITGVGPTADVTLTLQVAVGSLPPPASVITIVACALAQPLTPPATTPGDIASAPAYDCSPASVGRVAGDDGSISFLLPSSFQSKPGELDVALLPDPGGNPFPFSVAFDSPGPHAVAASTGPAAVPPAAPTPLAAPAPAVPVSSGSSAAPASFGSVGPPFGSIGLSFPGPTASGGASPVVPAGSSALGATSRPTVVTAPPAAAVGLPGDGRSHRIVAVALLLAITIAWWYVGSQPARAPRTLGALAGSDPPAPQPVHLGGIGRFRRPRVVPPSRR
jgi:hypothetical protein